MTNSAYFVEAGFTPMEALQTATSNPAHFLRKDDSYGSVEPGKTADLVLLRANPLDDIHNTCKISAVVANGRLFERPIWTISSSRYDRQLRTRSKEPFHLPALPATRDGVPMGVGLG